eukprot:TRINITY_DN3553_c0_g1_i2.p1 TRINITY_DN3553_c0_g1~~TRINITY_DN3553_c0_g1_i2.p1  ORF type:complete len:137 (+),score=6.98 TRINITY_DN3553_c0_g1_i2:70-480(+)
MAICTCSGVSRHGLLERPVAEKTCDGFLTFICLASMHQPAVPMPRRCTVSAYSYNCALYEKKDFTGVVKYCNKTSKSKEIWPLAVDNDSGTSVPGLSSLSKMNCFLQSVSVEVVDAVGLNFKTLPLCHAGQEERHG